MMHANTVKPKLDERDDTCPGDVVDNEDNPNRKVQGGQEAKAHHQGQEYTGDAKDSGCEHWVSERTMA